MNNSLMLACLVMNMRAVAITHQATVNKTITRETTKLITKRLIRKRISRTKKVNNKNVILRSLILRNLWSCSLGIIGDIIGGIIQTICSKGVKRGIMAAKPVSQKPQVLVYRRHMKKEIIIS